MKMPQVVQQVIDRIAGRSAADERDRRLDRIGQQVYATGRQLERLQEDAAVTRNEAESQRRYYERQAVRGDR